MDRMSANARNANYKTYLVAVTCISRRKSIITGSSKCWSRRS